MVELVLILLGAHLVHRRWWIVGAAGVAWTGFGVFFFVNALMSEVRISSVYFGIPPAIDCLFCLVGAVGSSGSVRLLRLGKAAVLAVVCGAILIYPWHGGMYVGFLIGTIFVVDACWRGSTAWLVRYKGWRWAVTFAVVEFLLGVWSYIPWPTNWDGEVGHDVGTLMIISGVATCLLALRLQRLRPGEPVAKVLARDWPDSLPDGSDPWEAPPAQLSSGTVTVHVWTPTGALVPIRRGVSRYVAALDERGRVSTGHAALEAPGVYISHYPAVEIERSRSQFQKTVRATDENDVPGLFQPSYEEERADWCPSTLQVRLDGLDTLALASFWANYRRDTTYNLIGRNCSVAVARALDVALEGVFAGRGRSPFFLLRLLLLPELWVAAVMRDRAATMTWTPGLVLDYARALAHLIALRQRLGAP